jgi:hypothetical protein
MDTHHQQTLPLSIWVVHHDEEVRDIVKWN